MDEEEYSYPKYSYSDIVCQRAICMTEVAMTYEGSTSPEVKHELLSVLKKLNLSLKMPDTASIVKLVVDTGSKL